MTEVKPLLVKHDQGLLKAFIRHESEEYRWRNGIRGPEAEAFRKRCFDEIMAWSTDKNVKIDYVILESCGNMGMVSSRLYLSYYKNWGMDANLLITFGTTPRDKLNFNLVKREGFGIRGWDEETQTMEL